MLCAQAWKPGSQHAGEKRGVAGLLLGRTEPKSESGLVCEAREVRLLPAGPASAAPGGSVQSACLQAAFDPGREAHCGLRLRSLAWAPRRAWGHSMRVRHVLPVASLLSSVSRTGQGREPSHPPGTNRGAPQAGVCVTWQQVTACSIRSEGLRWGQRRPPGEQRCLVTLSGGPPPVGSLKACA